MFTNLAVVKPSPLYKDVFVKQCYFAVVWVSVCIAIHSCIAIDILTSIFFLILNLPPLQTPCVSLQSPAYRLQFQYSAFSLQFPFSILLHPVNQILNFVVPG